jgi:hypothetical protein
LVCAIIHKALSQNKRISLSKSKQNINKNKKKSKLKQIEETETQQNSLYNKKPGMKPSDEKSPSNQTKDSNIGEEVSLQSHEIQKAFEELQQKLNLFENKIK